MRKPKELHMHDGTAECISEQPVFNEAFGVNVQAFIYNSKDIKRLRIWLEKAEKWILKKERYGQ